MQALAIHFSKYLTKIQLNIKLINFNECFFYFQVTPIRIKMITVCIYLINDFVLSHGNFICFLLCADSKKNQKLLYNKVDTTPPKPCPKLPLKSIAEMNAGLVRSNHDRYSRDYLMKNHQQKIELVVILQYKKKIKNTYYKS